MSATATSRYPSSIYRRMHDLQSAAARFIATQSSKPTGSVHAPELEFRGRDAEDLNAILNRIGSALFNDGGTPTTLSQALVSAIVDCNLLARDRDGWDSLVAAMHEFRNAVLDWHAAQPCAELAPTEQPDALSIGPLIYSDVRNAAAGDGAPPTLQSMTPTFQRILVSSDSAEYLALTDAQKMLYEEFRNKVVMG
jgi:hypothetical protein